MFFGNLRRATMLGTTEGEVLFGGPGACNCGCHGTDEPRPVSVQEETTKPYPGYTTFTYRWCQACWDSINNARTMGFADWVQGEIDDDARSRKLRSRVF